MELNWSTFILEIVNFLVLIWILKHFLYKPVLNLIAQRRAAIAKQTEQAQQLQESAETLKQQYLRRLTDWEQEREQARAALVRELEQERTRQLEALQDTLAQERAKVQAAQQRRQHEKVREIEHQALQHGAEFASRLLSRGCGPELESKLIDEVIDALQNLSQQQTDLLTEQWGEHPEQIQLCSAYPLSQAQKQALQQALVSIVGASIPVECTQSPQLLAGVHITIGAWVLQCNVRDELKGFTEFTRAAR